MACRLPKSAVCTVKRCIQCSAMSLTGVQCKNISCIRLPYCHVHAKKLLGLKVMKSTIPHAGCGLFTIKDIKKK